MVFDSPTMDAARPTLLKARACVAARIGDEITLKRIKQCGHTVQRHPENPDLTPIEVGLTRQELVIEGIAVGVIRSGSPL